MFFDQFSIVEYLKYASSFTYNSTHPACRFTLLYLGAEHPSIKCKLAPSSTIINVCSNCPDSGEFNLKYDCKGMSNFTPLGTYTNEPPDHTAACNATNLWSLIGTHFIKCSFTISG